jgi:predicted adenine nucleotide alpha hydrolase (AANH) superfamily ATPase
MREETDGMPLCLWCFELMLKKAAKTHEKLTHDFDSDDRLA